MLQCINPHDESWTETAIPAELLLRKKKQRPTIFSGFRLQGRELFREGSRFLESLGGSRELQRVPRISLML